jgi:LysM repeat protein
MRHNLRLPGIVGSLLAAAVFVACDSGAATRVAFAPTQEDTPIPTVGLPQTATPSSPPTLTTAPSPAASTPVGNTVEPAGTSYTVQAGDTLFSIAQRFGVSVDAIVAANSIRDPSLIAAGQALVIPVPGVIAPTGVQQPVNSTPAPPTLTPTPTPIPPPPTDVNGVPIAAFIVMPESVQQHVRDIYARGQSLGRNARAFSKLGDSTIENPHFLARFDEGPYNLANYAYLQDAIDTYKGSFARQGVAVRRGLHSWSVFDPLWADKTLCQPNEGPLPCEFRLHNPGIVLIRLGSNDIGVPDSFRFNLRKVVSYSIESGVIPVLGTKADRAEGPGNVNNDIIRQVAAEYNVPLWDFDLLAETLPNRGIDPSDGVHMTFYYRHDYSLPEAFQRGHAMHNLSALIMLDELRMTLAQGSP